MSTKTKKRTVSKSANSSGSKDFSSTITSMFLELLMVVKLYHWKTYSYAQHKATDDFYSSLNEHIDTFVEVLMGITGKRIDSVKLDVANTSFATVKNFQTRVSQIATYLKGLEKLPFFQKDPHTDLLNIRDEILGDINQLSYLFTLS
jgi:DNA-binding ferritin-like protein